MKKILFCVSLLIVGVLHANGQQPLLMSETSFLPVNLHYASLAESAMAEDEYGNVVVALLNPSSPGWYKDELHVVKITRATGVIQWTLHLDTPLLVPTPPNWTRWVGPPHVRYSQGLYYIGATFQMDENIETQMGFAVSIVTSQGTLVSQKITYSPYWGMQGTGVVLGGLEVLADKNQYVVGYTQYASFDTNAVYLKYFSTQNQQEYQTVTVPTLPRPLGWGEVLMRNLVGTPSGLGCIIGQSDTMPWLNSYVVHLDSNGYAVQWSTAMELGEIQWNPVISLFIKNGFINGTQQYVASISPTGVEGTPTLLPATYSLGVPRVMNFMNDTSVLITLFDQATHFVSFAGIDRSASVVWQIPYSEWGLGRVTQFADNSFAGVLYTDNAGLRIRFYSAPVSVQEYDMVPPLQLYPNPANDFVTIASPMKGTLTLYSMTGKKVLTYPVDEGNTQLSIQSLPSGIYVYHCHSATAYHTGRIVVSR